MNSYAILNQSVVDSSNNPLQQLSNLTISGLSTIDALMNSDSGRLYGSFTSPAGVFTLQLYSDSGKSNLVLSGTSSSIGLMNLTGANGSGLSGTVNVIVHSKDDTNIQAICFLSKDSDLPMDNLQVVSDYDPTYGFANFHLIAFQQIKEKIVARFESLLWSDALVDSRQINGGTGGYDLSKILSWQNSDLVEASANYALYLIARKQSVEPGSIFCEKAKSCYSKVTALLESIQISFDTNLTRIPRKTRAMSTFRMGRS